MFLSNGIRRLELDCIQLFLCDCSSVIYDNTVQIGTAQVGTVQVGIAQVGTAQVGIAQVGTFQLNNATGSSVNEVRLMQELKQTFLAVGIKTRENGQCPRSCNVAYFVFWV